MTNPKGFGQVTVRKQQVHLHEVAGSIPTKAKQYSKHWGHWGVMAGPYFQGSEISRGAHPDIQLSEKI